MLTSQLLLLALGVGGAEFCEDSSSSPLETCWCRLNIILDDRCSFHQLSTTTSFVDERCARRWWCGLVSVCGLGGCGPRLKDVVR